MKWVRIENYLTQISDVSEEELLLKSMKRERLGKRQQMLHVATIIFDLAVLWQK